MGIGSDKLSSYIGRRYENVVFGGTTGYENFLSIPLKGYLGFNELKTIRNALNGYYYPSKLDGYSCKNCYSICNCTQQVYMMDPPKYLIINLKRFNLYSRPPKKVDIEVTNDLEIDISDYLITKNDKPSETRCKYCLYGIVEHSGSINSGHYVAYVKYKDNSGTHKWYYVSDSMVSESSEQEAVNAQGFLLFYKRNINFFNSSGVPSSLYPCSPPP